MTDRTPGGLRGLDGLQGKVIATNTGDKWTVVHSLVIEAQDSSSVSLVLDLRKSGSPSTVSIRLLFSAETHELEQSGDIAWILSAVRQIVDGGRLREDGVYSID